MHVQAETSFEGGGRGWWGICPLTWKIVIFVFLHTFFSFHIFLVTCAFICKVNVGVPFDLDLQFKVIENKLFGKKIYEFLYVDNVTGTKRAIFKDGIFSCKTSRFLEKLKLSKFKYTEGYP